MITDNGTLTLQVHTIRMGAATSLRNGPGTAAEQLQLPELHLVLHRLPHAAGMRLPAKVGERGRAKYTVLWV